MSASLRVELGSRSYDILIGPGLLQEAGAKLKALLPKTRAVIITDSHVAPHYLEQTRGSIQESGLYAGEIILPAGEKTKNFAQLAELADQLLALKPERNWTLIALGGGVIGDITGFLASILLRGIHFMQIPTSLLAQVDSSVGGKTGINTKYGKNLLGTFYQPVIVLADTELLHTLPKREMLAGYAEIVKYGLINRPNFYDWCEKQGNSLLHDPQLLTQAIYESCASKAAIVAEDEREGGTRALLNLGHTFGHALEADMGYGDSLLHGEAVALGTLLAFAFSVREGLCPKKDFLRVRNHFIEMKLPTSLMQLGRKILAERLTSHMMLDKKNKNGGITLILARSIGCAFIQNGVDSEKIRTFLQDQLQKDRIDV